MTDHITNAAAATEHTLLPCPLCRSTNVQIGIYYADDHPGVADAVRCITCGCRASRTSWETRTPDDAQPAAKPIAWTNEMQLSFLKDPAYAEIPMAMWGKSGGYADIPLYAARPPAAPVETIDSVPSCGQENDYRRASPQRSSAATEGAVAWRVKNDFGHWHITQDKALADTYLDIEKLDVQPLYLTAPPRGNYEDRHPTDDILWSASDHKDFIEVVEVLGIQESFQTPAEAVRELHAEIDRLRAVPQEVPVSADAADAARYRHLKEHASYYYAEGYDPPTPREFGISWEHQDCTPARPSMDWLIDQEIEAKRLEALEDGADDDASSQVTRPHGGGK